MKKYPIKIEIKHKNISIGTSSLCFFDNDNRNSLKVLKNTVELQIRKIHNFNKNDIKYILVNFSNYIEKNYDTFVIFVDNYSILFNINT